MQSKMVLYNVIFYDVIVIAGRYPLGLKLKRKYVWRIEFIYCECMYLVDTIFFLVSHNRCENKKHLFVAWLEDITIQ